MASGPAALTAVDHAAASSPEVSLVSTRLLAATADGLRQSLPTQMPAGGLRDYYQWGLDPDQPYHGQFLRATSATQLANLTATLLAGLVPEAHWPQLTPYVVRMNIYQVYEVVSDDLGSGVLSLLDGSHGPVDHARRGVLRAFNDAMRRRLAGEPTPARDLLTGLAPAAGAFCLFEHSLGGAAHRRLVAAFTGGPDTVDIGLWPALVANIESAAALADRMAGNPLGDQLRDGLASRYGAVNRTLTDRHLPVVDLVAVGAQAILVAPTLAYYIGALADVGRPVRGLARVVRDGTLPDALADAAVLVRLLNDIGPALLDPDPRHRQALFGALSRAYQRDPDSFPGIGALLQAAAPRTLAARLRKDLRYREFNVSLYGLRQAGTVPEAIATLTLNLDYYAQLYALHRARLRTALRRLATRLDDCGPSTLVARFVRFHKRLYAHPYDSTDGEYAT